jgi:hypothetical protein
LQSDITVSIQLASLVVHLAEYIDTGEPADLAAARGILQSPSIAQVLKPNVLLPVTRSGKSVAEILEGIGR